MRRRGLEVWIGVVVLGWLALGTAAPAHAHPVIDEGLARYAQADFPAALEAFARAEEADDLTRDDLLVLLERRILVHIVLGDQEAANRDLARLHAVDPEHELSPDVPPELVEAFQSSTDPRLTVELETEPTGEGVSVRVTTHGDPGDLVRELRIHHQVDDGAWELSTGASVELSASSSVRLHAEAVGPGGAIVATAASRDTPRDVRLQGATPSSESDDTLVWVGLGIGAGVLVAAVLAISIGIATSGGSSQTSPRYPVIEF